MTSVARTCSRRRTWMQPPRPAATLLCRKLAASSRDVGRGGEGAPLEPQRSPEELVEMQENKLIEDKVQGWLKEVIIGMNLCPFAERPVREHNLRIFVVRGSDEEQILSSILVVLFLQEDKPGTSLIVCPECYPSDFSNYLDVVNMVEEGLLEENDMVGKLQIAPFHPLFQFDGSDVEGVDNWTNRSPYPIFHVLREDEVARAADSLGGDASLVWKRNIGLLEALADQFEAENFETLFTSRASVQDKAKLNKILKEHKLNLNPKKT
jgi:hypothetical protein